MKKVAIHSVPRSGSSWLGEIFNSSPNVAYRFQPLFSYAFKGRIDEQSTAGQIERFFDDIGRSNDDFIGQREKRESGRMPVFRKDHIECVAYKEVRYHNVLERMLAVTSDVRVVGLLRNPLSVVDSWLRAPREFRGDLGWVPREEWRFAPKKNEGRPEEYHGYEKWKEAAHLFHALERAHPDRFRRVVYADLLADTPRIVADLFDWAELEFGPQTRDFVAESREHTVDDAYAVYRADARDDRWREGLDREIVRDIVRDLRGTPLEYLLDLSDAELHDLAGAGEYRSPGTPSGDT